MPSDEAKETLSLMYDFPVMPQLREFATILIQAFWRMSRDRKRYWTVQRGVRRMQAAVRGTQFRQELRVFAVSLPHFALL